MCATFDDSLLAQDLLGPLTKVAALLATGYAVHRSLSPPNPPPAPKTCIDNRTLFERAIRHVTFCSKMMTWAVVLADALVTLHLALPSPYTRPLAAALLPSSFLPPSPPPSSSSIPSFSSSLSSPTPSPFPAPSHPPHTPTSLSSPAPALALLTPSLLLILGALLACAGAALRIACFRALGALFTFELTISPKHTLVTAGPYAHVRHPSYTGVFATLAGASCVMLAPGAWVREAWLAPGLCELVSFVRGEGEVGRCTGVEGGWGGMDGARAALAWAFVAFWTAKVVYAGRSTLRRVQTEDGELHRVFGGVWEEWAARVRWRLCPGVY